MKKILIASIILTAFILNACEKTATTLPVYTPPTASSTFSVGLAHTQDSVNVNDTVTYVLSGFMLDTTLPINYLNFTAKYDSAQTKSKAYFPSGTIPLTFGTIKRTIGAKNADGLWAWSANLSWPSTDFPTKISTKTKTKISTSINVLYNLTYSTTASNLTVSDLVGTNKVVVVR